MKKGVGGKGEKNKGEETPQKYPSLWVQN